MRVEYDLDVIIKPASKLFGRVQRMVDGTFSLHLTPGIPEALQKAGLVDEGGYVNKNGKHYFSLTLDDHSFTYVIEPYGFREYHKPNSVMIIFYPAEVKVGKKKMYVGYRDGETDALFRKIMDAVTNKNLGPIVAQARNLSSLTEVHRGIQRNRRTNRNSHQRRASENVLSTSNLVGHIGSFIANTHRNRGNTSFRQTQRVLKNRATPYQKTRATVMETIRENSNNNNGNRAE